MRHNITFIYGRITSEGVRAAKDEEGKFSYALCRIDTIRSKSRTVEDNKVGTQHEHLLVVSRDPEKCKLLAELKPNDIVMVKGTITTKKMRKTSTCPNCGKKNQSAFGNVLYVTPVFVEKEMHCDSKADAIGETVKRDEISNSVTIIGTLIRDPKIFRTKSGLQITQYPIAIDRKYMIRQDDPSIRTDWPYVKSYGEQARDDKIFLHYQSDVFIDGFLQRRGVLRHAVCPFCGKAYDWKDYSMEIVPYTHAIEYMNNFYSREEVEAKEHQTVEEIQQKLFNAGSNDKLDEETTTLDIVEDENSENQ